LNQNFKHKTFKKQQNKQNTQNSTPKNTPTNQAFQKKQKITPNFSISNKRNAPEV
jgi:hypothetical protein